MSGRQRGRRTLASAAVVAVGLAGCASSHPAVNAAALPSATVSSVTIAPASPAFVSSSPSVTAQATPTQRRATIRPWGSTLAEFMAAYPEDPKTTPGSAFEPTPGLGPADGSETDRFYGLSFGDAGGVTSTMEERFPRGTHQAAATAMAKASLPSDSKLLWQAFNTAGQCYVTEFVSARLLADGYDHGAVRIEYDSVDFTSDPAKNYDPDGVSSADFEPYYDPTAAEQAPLGCET